MPPENDPSNANGLTLITSPSGPLRLTTSECDAVAVLLSSMWTLGRVVQNSLQLLKQHTEDSPQLRRSLREVEGVISTSEEMLNRRLGSLPESNSKQRAAK
jgi:hypothetical protein